MNSLVKEIQDLLISTGGYRQILMPLRVGDIEFRFDSVLLGPSGADDLAIIVDLQAIAGNAIRRRIRGLVTVLDRLNSRRSVSIILVIRSEPKFELEDLDKYCHVCIVRPDRSLESSLLSLLPLVLPSPSTEYETAEGALKQELGSSIPDSFSALIERAAKNKSDVQEYMEKEIDRIIDELERWE